MSEEEQSLFLFQEMQRSVEGDEVLQAMAGVLDFTLIQMESH